jgi:hypothetical protein
VRFYWLSLPFSLEFLLVSIANVHPLPDTVELFCVVVVLAESTLLSSGVLAVLDVLQFLQRNNLLVLGILGISGTYNLGGSLGLPDPLLQRFHLILGALEKRQLFPQQVLDPLIQLNVILGYQGHCLARSTSSRRPTHSMDVIFAVCWDVVV